MTITTRDNLIAALGNNATRLVVDKASIANMVVGQFASLWRATGQPGQGAIPTTAAICTSALTGAMPFVNPTTPADSYFAQGWLACSNVGCNVEVHDRLAHVGGLSGVVTTSQGALSLSGLNAARLGATDYSQVQWWLDVYTDMGSTSTTATVAVTYNDDTTGNLAVITLGATPRAGRRYPLISAVPGKWIKSVTGVTLTATTGTAGNFGITATRAIAGFGLNVANKVETYDWGMTGLSRIEDDACMELMMLCGTTSTGVVRGGLKLAHG